jgi:hypothetical protein
MIGQFIADGSKSWLGCTHCHSKRNDNTVSTSDRQIRSAQSAVIGSWSRFPIVLRNRASQSCFQIVLPNRASKSCFAIVLRNRASQSCFAIVLRNRALFYVALLIYATIYSEDKVFFAEVCGVVFF